jgi:hypothetical protein
MKTLQEQYNLIKEGKGNKDFFMKSVRNIFPEYVNQYTSYDDAVGILKNKSILSEGIGGVVTKGKTPDWHSIFNENMNKLKEDDTAKNQENIKKAVEYYNQNAGRVSMKDAASKFNVGEFDVVMALQQGATSGIKFENTTEAKKAKPDFLDLDNDGNKKESMKQAAKDAKKPQNEGEEEDDAQYEEMIAQYELLKKNIEDFGLQYLKNLTEAKEAKAIEKETTKEVTDMATQGYDYKDPKNIDNVYGQAFLVGYYAEIKDPKNKDKSVDEVKSIVAKNLVKNINHYVENAQFGIKGIGYTTDAPGLGESKPAKGKYKSSGYGNLSESAMYDDSDGDRDSDMESMAQANEYYEKGLEAYSEGDLTKAEEYYQAALKAGAWLGWTEVDLPPYNSMNESLEESKLRSTISTLIKEALNMKEIEEVGEDAKKKAMGKKIDEEITKRKKKLKALTTLTELEEDSVNPKKIKELNADIKKLESAKKKLNKGKKDVDEALFDDPTTSTDKPVVATSSASTTALKKAGMKEIPGTKDAK